MSERSERGRVAGRRTTGERSVDERAGAERSADDRYASVVRYLVPIGVVAVTTTLVLVVRPSLLPRQVEAVLGELVGTVGTDRLLLGVAIILGVFGLWKAARDYRSDADGEFVRSQPATARAVTGGGFDEDLARAMTRVGGEGDEGGADEVEERLRRVAIDVRTLTTGRPHEEAERDIATGDWTDDAVVASFLAGDDGPPFPIRHRLYAWLVPERALESRVDRTVSEFSRQLTADESAKVPPGQDITPEEPW